MIQPISFSKVLDHEKLSERLMALRAIVAAARKDAPDNLASPTLCGAAGQLLRDLYRLVSREPGARALPRLDPRHPPDLRTLSTMLRDAQVALDAFAYAHRDHDDDYGDKWLTVEAIEAFHDDRKKLSPSGFAAR
ncbi:hypothetical protein [Devosia naphthalenivorans]|uniref:hypothetical protein n=1 Tax=Devosia naphthalenivorans TaxID=2082392 RepID=UPI000D3752F3|nr:hypothetical protein [Devosia naphthalenivorans]